MSFNIRSGCIVTQTPDEYQYQYVWPKIQTGVTSFTFKVRASNDAHVALSSTNADTEQMYEIGKTKTFNILGHFPLSTITFNNRPTEDQYNDSLRGLLKTSNESVIIVFDSVIGGWSNDKSAIRLCKQCPNEVIESTPDILSDTEYHEFRISFGNDFVEVSRVGGQPFMSFRNQTSFDVSYAGIATWYESEGHWEFCGLGKHY